jgi:hypothetical protein
MSFVRHARRRARVALAAVVVAGAAASGSLAITGGAAGSPPVRTAGGLGFGKPAVPVGGAYFGVDPNFGSGDGAGQRAPEGGTTVGDLAVLQSQIGRTSSIVSFYSGFTQAPPLEGMVAVAAQGSVPMISWHCGAPDTAVASGAWDGVVRAAAEAYKSFGRPVFLRWFWEMNLDYGNHPYCLGTSSNPQQDYVNAYIRIWKIFQQVGATNVAFVWCPSASPSAHPSTAFYPGPAYVDWIGLDLYDRRNYASFASVFGTDYDIYASPAYGKPLMIAETGACGVPTACSGGAQFTQAQWAQQLQADLPSQFPYVRALVYVDASDLLGNYILTGAGLTAFTALARSDYFAQVG